MTENHPRWRAAQRELEATVAAHPYQREADELINLVFDNHFNSAKRTLAVADWLREYVAAREFGCTGLTADPDGPELAPREPESDPPGSGSWREARGAVPRPPGSPSAEEAIRRGRDVLDGATDEEIDGFLEAVRPELPSPEDWARIRRVWAGESLTTIQREVMEKLIRDGMEKLIRDGAIIRDGDELGPE